MIEKSYYFVIFDQNRPHSHTQLHVDFTCMPLVMNNEYLTLQILWYHRVLYSVSASVSRINVHSLQVQ